MTWEGAPLLRSDFNLGISPETLCRQLSEGGLWLPGAKEPQEAGATPSHHCSKTLQPTFHPADPLIQNLRVGGSRYPCVFKTSGDPVCPQGSEKPLVEVPRSAFWSLWGSDPNKC